MWQHALRRLSVFEVTVHLGVAGVGCGPDEVHSIAGGSWHHARESRTRVTHSYFNVAPSGASAVATVFRALNPTAAKT